MATWARAGVVSLGMFASFATVWIIFIYIYLLLCSMHKHLVDMSLQLSERLYFQIRA